MDPQQIGRYPIEKKLKSGGMGVVYLARDPILDRKVAIKVIAAQYHEDEEARARFEREARVVAGFQHPNIVQVFELSNDAETGAPFIVMEYVDGADLQTLIKNRVLIPFERKLDLVIQICQGLHYSHEHDIVHRDIKPGNILVRRDGTAHIVDFGLARIKSSEMTLSGPMGTLDYMSPEQANSARDLDRRSDLFSLGLVLYELVSLTRPFYGNTILQKLTLPHRPLSAVLPGCDEELVRIVNKTLEKDPSDRFADCLELAEALGAFRKSLPERQAGLRRVVEDLHTKLQTAPCSEVPKTLAGLFNGFLFDLEPARSRPENLSGIDFGPVEPDSDYGCLLFSLAEMKSQLEAVAARLKSAQSLRTDFLHAREHFDFGRLADCLLVLEQILRSHPGATQAAALKRECLHLLDERRDPVKRDKLAKTALDQAREAMKQG
ncbi:MAG: serine/threonine protein kinase, partial [Terriglobia bacterium]